MFGEERSLETLSKQDAIALLAAIPVSRVVFTVGALPAIVPVAFAVHDGAVAMRTSAESRLARAAPGGVLAFEIDDTRPAGNHRAGPKSRGRLPFASSGSSCASHTVKSQAQNRAGTPRAAEAPPVEKDAS